jgi:hypothetical protein
MTRCSFGCGHDSSGRDLADHQRYERARCTECGPEPPGPAHTVTHDQGCPRPQPGYVHPADRADDPLATFLAGFSEVRFTGTPQQFAEALDAARRAEGAERAAQGVHCVSVIRRPRVPGGRGADIRQAARHRRQVPGRPDRPDGRREAHARYAEVISAADWHGQPDPDGWHLIVTAREQED